MPQLASRRERQLRHRADGGQVAAEHQRRDPRALPLGQSLTDALARTAQRHFVDERVGHGGFRLRLLTGQVEILDPPGGVLVALAARQLVVEILAAPPPPPHPPPHLPPSPLPAPLPL